MKKIEKTLPTKATLTIKTRNNMNVSRENVVTALFSLIYRDYASLNEVSEEINQDILRIRNLHYMLPISCGAPQILEINKQMPPDIMQAIEESGHDEVVSLDLDQNYAPAVLFNYILSGLYSIKPSLDFHHFESFAENLRLRVEDPEHGHTGSGEFLYRCLQEDIFGMVPQDENGVVYAINPIFELSKKEFIALISSDEFNLNEYVEHVATTILTRLTTPGCDIPVAHEDYQHTIVCKLGGLQYASNYVECTSCGRISFKVKEWILKDGMIVAHPEFYEQCAAKSYKPAPASPSARAFSVDVPTGDMFFGDWLRDDSGFGVSSLEKHSFNINFPHERLLASSHYAELNVVYGSIGNEACHLYANQEGTVLYILGHIGNPDKLNELGIKKVGSICTDLWGYTLMDRAHLEPISSPAYRGVMASITEPDENHDWERPGMVRIQTGKYWHYYFNAYEEDIHQSAAELPESICNDVLQLAPNALHAVLVHDQLIKHTGE